MKYITIVSALVLCLAVSAHGTVLDDLNALVSRAQQSVNPSLRARLALQARVNQMKQFSKIAANTFTNMKDMSLPSSSLTTGPRLNQHGRFRALATFDYSGCSATVATTECKAAADNFVAGECWKLGDALEAFFSAGTLTEAQSSLIISECSKCATAFDKALRTCSAIFQCATAPGYKQPTADEVKLWAVQAGPMTRAVCAKDSQGNTCAVSLKASLANLDALSKLGDSSSATSVITEDWARGVCTECMTKFAKAVAFSYAGVRKVKGTVAVSSSSDSSKMDFPTSIRVLCLKADGKYCLPEFARGAAEIAAIGTKMDSAGNDFNAILSAFRQMINLICGNRCMRRLFHLMSSTSPSTSNMVNIVCMKNAAGKNCIMAVLEFAKTAIESNDPSKLPAWLIQGGSCFNSRGTCTSSCVNLFNDATMGCCSGTFVAIENPTNLAYAKRCNYGIPDCPKPDKPASAKLATKIAYSVYLKKKSEMDAAAKHDVSEATGAPESDITVVGQESAGAATGTSGTRLLASNVDFLVTISSDEPDAQETYAATLKEEVATNSLEMPSTSVVVSEETGENPDSIAVVDASATTVTGAGGNSATAATVSMVAVVVASLFAILF